MDTKLLFLQLQHVCQLILSFYGVRHSLVAITNLQKYEETTKKAAKWSQEVQNQLWQTRYTQGTGFVTIILSLTAASTLLFAGSRLPKWALYTISPAMLFITLGAREYMKKFWTPSKDSRGKDVGTKVPLPNMAEYNLAVQKTEDLITVMEYLEYSWVISSFFTGIIDRNL